MNSKLYIAVLLLHIFSLSYVSGEIYSATLLSTSSKEIKVGMPVVLEYEIPFVEEFLLSSALVEDISDDVIVNLLHVSILSRKDDKIQTLKVQIEVLPVISGVIYIPDIHSENHRIHFPYIHVQSSLDKNDLLLKQTGYYIPWIEMGEVLLYMIILICFLAYVLFVFLKVYAQSASTKHILSNFLNLKSCIRKVDRLTTVLKKMGTNKTRKYIVSIDCYALLWKIVHKRLAYFIDKQLIDAFTGDEIATLMITCSHQVTVSNEHIHAFFVTIDEVLYGNKQFSIDKRIQDCMILREILLHTFRFKWDKSKKYTELSVLNDTMNTPPVVDAQASYHTRE